MIKSFGKYWQNFAEFAPRTRRRDFWFAVLANLIINGALIAAYFFVPFFKYVLVAYGIVCLCPNLAVTVRRLHDTGTSGNFLFILLIPVVGAIIVFIKLLKDSYEEENLYGISEKYASPKQIQQTQSAPPVQPAPMYIPPIYNTDKAEEPPVIEEKPEAPAFTEDSVRLPEPEAPVQPVRTDRFTVEQADEAENEFTVLSPAAREDTEKAQEVSDGEERKITVNVPDSGLNEQQYSASRPVYSTVPPKKPEQEQPKQERPKGYRSRSFPYGH